VKRASVNYIVEHYSDDMQVPRMEGEVQTMSQGMWRSSLLGLKHVIILIIAFL
jgi:hypothetical protein